MRSKSQFSQLEEEMIKIWDKEQIFYKSIDNRKGQKRFRFYDGPPFTSGPPHYGHVEQSSLKDAIARYKTMQGYYVPRRTGCDTHGLPIENLVEKEKGFKTKKDITKYGIDKFNEACQAVVFRHKKDFDNMYKRLGRWDDPKHTYATLDDNYIESIWWAFAQLYNKDLIYKGFKSVPYCPRCATPLSNFEMNDGYKDNVIDPSVYVKFRLKKEPKTSLLAWTTTPWTLPANAALAVDKKANYIKIELEKGEQLILAKNRINELDLKKGEYKLVKNIKGSELVGLEYKPLFEFARLTKDEQKTAFKVYHDDSVSLDDGTGILHVAPRYGETDLAMGQRLELPMIESVDSNGLMVRSTGRFSGIFFKEADKPIIADLTKQGLIFAAEEAPHTYPFCWRCDTPLMYFATDSWFVAVTKIKDQLVEEGAKIKWVPKHVKRGRWLKWLEGARDWAISRTRFWGAPLPVWQNVDDPDDRIVVGSIEELKKLSGVNNFNMHRPDIDEVVIEKDGKKYKRIEEVFDCWFESGSMPYGQDHYPFENKEEFDSSFPADFICEAIEMVHLWFYTLHVMGVALKGQYAYQNVVASGLILAADGKKLSKRLRNYPPIEQLLDNYGADTTRFFVLNSPLMNGQDTRLNEATFRDIYRNVFMTLFNSYKFFKIYADIDGWKPPIELTVPNSENVLDTWILSRLHQTQNEVTANADKYQIHKATRPITELIDDISNWYVRRSRRRFWKSENDSDKEQAYLTLHYVLIRTCQLLAPWAPFISDKIYRDLRADKMPNSVHLTDWPQAGNVNELLVDEMKRVRNYISDGLAIRAAAKIKVRQPLQSAKLPKLPKLYEEILKEELNVKEIEWAGAKDKVEIDTRLTPELKREGLTREIIRQVQNARKSAGFNVDDRIRLVLNSTSADLNKAITEHSTTIKHETLAKSLDSKGKGTYATKVDIEGSELEIALAKDG